MGSGLETEFTEQRGDQIANLLTAGADWALACLNAGVDPNAAQDWVARGELADGSNPEDAPFINFARNLRMGQVKAEARAVALVFNAQEKNPRLAEEWLKKHGGAARRLAPGARALVPDLPVVSAEMMQSKTHDAVKHKAHVVLEMTANGWYPYEIAAHLGVPRQFVVRLLGKTGIGTRAGKGGRYDGSAVLRRAEIRWNGDRRRLHRVALQLEDVEDPIEASAGLARIQQSKDLIDKQELYVHDKLGLLMVAGGEERPDQDEIDRLRKLSDEDFQVEEQRIIELEQDTRDPSRYRARLGVAGEASDKP